MPVAGKYTMLKILGLLTALGIITVVVGLSLGWFSFSKASEGSGTSKATGITLNVNEGRIKDDASAVKDKTVELVESGKDALTKETRVEGKVTNLDLAVRRLTVSPESGPEMTLTVKDGAAIEVNGSAASLTDLRRDDHVVARYRSEGSVYVASSVLVTRSN